MKLLLLSFLSSVTTTTIPVRYDSKRIPFVLVEVANSESPQSSLGAIPMKLMSDHLGRPYPRGLENEHEAYQIRFLQNPTSPSPALIVVHSGISADNVQTVDKHLSVGYGSDFLSQFGNWLLIPPYSSHHSIGSMVIGSENPSTHCTDRRIEYFGIHVTSTIYMDSNQISACLPFVVSLESEYIRVDRDSFRSFIQQIRRVTSLVQFRRWSISVSDCTDENLEQFPIISFGLVRGHETVMYVSIEPEDYIRRHATGCDILIRPTVDQNILGQPFLSAVAVHFTDTSIGFCEPL